MLKKEPSLKLLRYQLGSIDLSDTKLKKEMSESERISYCAQIFAVFPVIEKDIEKMIYEQLMFASNNTEDWGQVLFSRGTTNGMMLLLDLWKKASSEYEAKGKDKDFDKNNPINEI
jgi:hypothetical protein